MAKHRSSSLLKCPTCKQPWPNDEEHELRGFSWLDPLPRNIRPSNFDGILAVLHDRKGNRFLVIEAKEPSEPIDAGQAELLRGLAAIPNFTVRVLRGTAARMLNYVVTPSGIESPRSMTGVDARRGVLRWYGEVETVTSAPSSIAVDDFSDLEVDWPDERRTA